MRRSEGFSARLPLRPKQPTHIPPTLSGRRAGLLVRLVANGLAQAAAAVATALLIEFAFDRLVMAAAPRPATTTLWVGLALAAATGGGAWLRMIERIDAERLGQAYIYDVRMGLYDHLTALAPWALQGRSQGGVMLRFVGDLTAMRQWVSLGLARLLVAGATTLGALLALSLASWVLSAGVAVVLIAGTLGALSRGRAMQAVVREARRRRTHLAANVNEQVASIAVVQAFGQTDRERRRMARQSRRLQRAMVKRARVAGEIRAIADGTAGLATGAALLLGAAEVSTGRASPGTVVAAMTIVGFLVSPLRDLGRVEEYWHSAVVARQKLDQFLATPSLVTEAAGAPDLRPGPGRLEFDNVSLSGALDGVSAVAEPGAIVAVVGPNGAGKSTLLSLAARLIDPEQGAVRLDGQDLAEHSLASVRREVGMAGPDLPLLRGTVDRNLRYRWPDAPEEETARVRSLCGVDDVLAELPEGAETRISEGGRGLSAGQRQRIALARALLGNPRVLLLDEADANLDPQASAVVDRVLADYEGTVLLVTHRADRLAAADAIWHLEAGKLVDAGPAAEVLAAGPTARLFATKAGPQADPPGASAAARADCAGSLNGSSDAGPADQNARGDAA